MISALVIWHKTHYVCSHIIWAFYDASPFMDSGLSIAGGNSFPCFHYFSSSGSCLWSDESSDCLLSYYQWRVTAETTNSSCSTRNWETTHLTTLYLSLVLMKQSLLNCYFYFYYHIACLAFIYIAFIVNTEFPLIMHIYQCCSMLTGSCFSYFIYNYITIGSDLCYKYCIQSDQNPHLLWTITLFYILHYCSF